MPLEILTPPVGLAIGLDEIKDHLRIDTADEENALLERYIGAATEAAEGISNRALRETTYKLTVKGFREVIELPKSPLQEVMEVKYFDENDQEQEYTAFDFAKTEPGRVYFGDFPATSEAKPFPVSITYKAGYKSGKVPDDLQLWMMNVIGTAYMQKASIARGNPQELKATMTRLMANKRVWRF